jgi:hypothetical protein
LAEAQSTIYVGCASFFWLAHHSTAPPLMLIPRSRPKADGSKRDERGRRLFAASEVRAAGWGGLAAVSSITGLARSTIERGLKDLDDHRLPLAKLAVKAVALDD